MPGVEKMALVQRRMLRGTGVENPVRYINDPGANAQNRDPNQRNPNPCGAGKTPGPENGDRRSIEAQQMPIDGYSPQS